MKWLDVLCLIVLCAISGYIIWHGITIKTGHFSFEQYPLSRFFNK